MSVQMNFHNAHGSATSGGSGLLSLLKIYYDQSDKCYSKSVIVPSELLRKRQENQEQYKDEMAVKKLPKSLKPRTRPNVLRKTSFPYVPQSKVKMVAEAPVETNNQEPNALAVATTISNSKDCARPAEINGNEDVSTVTDVVGNVLNDERLPACDDADEQYAAVDPKMLHIADDDGFCDQRTAKSLEMHEQQDGELTDTEGQPAVITQQELVVAMTQQALVITQEELGQFATRFVDDNGIVVEGFLTTEESGNNMLSSVISLAGEVFYIHASADNTKLYFINATTTNSTGDIQQEVEAAPNGVTTRDAQEINFSDYTMQL